MRRALLEKFMQRSPRGIILFRVRRRPTAFKAGIEKPPLSHVEFAVPFPVRPQKRLACRTLDWSQFYARRLPLNFAAPSVVSSSV